MPGLRRRSWGMMGVALMLVPLTSAAAGCTTCDKKSCVQPGVYLYSGDLAVGDVVTTCVDSACHTATVAAPLDPPTDDLGTLVQNQFPLEADAKITVSITITDAGGTKVASLSERRRVPSGGSACECISFFYRWTKNTITRFA
jgi:hypothetical protein